MGNSDHPVRIPINPIKNPIFIDTLARMRIISTKFFFQKMQKSPKNIHSIWNKKKAKPMEADSWWVQFRRWNNRPNRREITRISNRSPYRDVAGNFFNKVHFSEYRYWWKPRGHMQMRRVKRPTLSRPWHPSRRGLDAPDWFKPTWAIESNLKSSGKIWIIPVSGWWQVSVVNSNVIGPFNWIGEEEEEEEG